MESMQNAPRPTARVSHRSHSDHYPQEREPRVKKRTKNENQEREARNKNQERDEKGDLTQQLNVESRSEAEVR